MSKPSIMHFPPFCCTCLGSYVNVISPGSWFNYICNSLHVACLGFCGGWTFLKKCQGLELNLFTGISLNVTVKHLHAVYMVTCYSSTVCSNIRID